MAGDPLADLRADLAKPEPAAPPESGTAPATWRDPWAKIMQTITPKLDQAGVLGSKEGYLRQAGGMVIPQNTAEAVLAAMMVAQPELGLAKLGVPLMEKVAAKGVIPGLTRAALRGLTTAGVGKATGHPALESGAMGAAGSMFGETLGRATSSYMDSAAAKLALGNMTKDLSDRFQATIGQWLPKPKEGAAAHSPERILRSVWSGEATANVSAELNRIKAAHANTPVPVIDLAPQMTEAGVVFAEAPAPSKLTPGRELATRRGMSPTKTLGEALDAIEASRTKWAKVTGPEGEIRMVQLRALEDTLAMRADPNYANVLKQWGRTKQLQDWLDVKAPSLFDGRTGKLSWEGYAELAQRLGKQETNAGRLPSFTPEEISGFGTAMRLDLERGGMVWGEPGRSPIKSLGIGKTALPYVHPQMPRGASMPGLSPATLTPAAVRAITGQMPLHLTPDRRDE